MTDKDRLDLMTIWGECPEARCTGSDTPNVYVWRSREWRTAYPVTYVSIRQAVDARVELEDAGK